MHGVLSGYVCVRCKRGFELKRGANPDRVCVRRLLDAALMSSWITRGIALDLGGDIAGRATKGAPAPAWVPDPCGYGSFQHRPDDVPALGSRAEYHSIFTKVRPQAALRLRPKHIYGDHAPRAYYL